MICNYSVYIHINKKNGKKYVGITQFSPQKRWKNGKGYMHNIHFQRAIEKYGWEGFEHIVVYSQCSKEVAEEIEKDMIATLQTNNPNKGYNIREGGHAGKHSEESKRKMSIAKKLQSQDAEYRKKLSECHKGIPAKNKGIPMSEEQKRKVSLSKTGVPNYKTRKPVFCLELNKSFGSLKEASQETGANISKISECCHGDRKTAGGFHWIYESEVKNGKTEQRIPIRSYV